MLDHIPSNLALGFQFYRPASNYTACWQRYKQSCLSNPTRSSCHQSTCDTSRRRSYVGDVKRDLLAVVRLVRISLGLMNPHSSKYCAHAATRNCVPRSRSIKPFLRTFHDQLRVKWADTWRKDFLLSVSCFSLQFSKCRLTINLELYCMLVAFNCYNFTGDGVQLAPCVLRIRFLYVWLCAYLSICHFVRLVCPLVIGKS